MSYTFYFVIVLGLAYWVDRPYFLYPNSLKIRKSPADELDSWLKQFNWGNRQDLKDPGRLPSYKFYTEVVEVLLQLARKMGGNYQESILFLREGLQSDKQFEKKIKEASLGMYLQMGMMMFLTWAFILGALSLVDVKVKTFHLMMIFIWQAVGMSLLPLTSKRLRVKYFGDIGVLWKMLYILKSLMRVPLSRSEILTFAGAQDLLNIKQKSLKELTEKVKEMCQKTLKQGSSYEEDLKYLMEELRFQEKWHFELFEKRLTVIKLVLLTVFFLPSYLAFIFLLLSDLMALM